MRYHWKESEGDVAIEGPKGGGKGSAEKEDNQAKYKHDGDVDEIELEIVDEEQ